MAWHCQMACSLVLGFYTKSYTKWALSESSIVLARLNLTFYLLGASTRDLAHSFIMVMDTKMFLFEAAKQNDRISGCTVLLLIEKWIKLVPNAIGNRIKDCAWGCTRGISTTWENLQIEKHKSGRRSFRSLDWFVLFDLQIFSGGVYPPSTTSRTISFSISNSFWY